MAILEKSALSSQMTTTTDAASHLHEAAKYMLAAALVFAVLTVGLAERCRKDKLLEDLSKFTMAREYLHSALQERNNDACWNKFTSFKSDFDAQRVTLEQMESIECDEPSGAIRFQGKRLDTPSETNWLMVPIYEPIRSTKLISDALRVLWDEDRINKTRRYSSVVSWKFYEWRRLRQHIIGRQQARYKDLEREIQALTVADLDLINGAATNILTDIDETIKEDFSASVPKWSLGVSIYTAARISSLAVTLFIVLLAACVHAASRDGGLAQPGTLFAAVLSSWWFRFPALLVLLVPAFSIFVLFCAFPSSEPWIWKLVVLGAAFTATGYTIYIIIKILPERARLYLRRLKQQIAFPHWLSQHGVEVQVRE